MTTTDNKRHNYKNIFKYNNRGEAQYKVKGYNNKAIKQLVLKLISVGMNIIMRYDNLSKVSLLNTPPHLLTNCPGILTISDI